MKKLCKAGLTATVLGFGLWVIYKVLDVIQTIQMVRETLGEMYEKLNTVSEKNIKFSVDCNAYSGRDVTKADIQKLCDDTWTSLSPVKGDVLWAIDALGF